MSSQTKQANNCFWRSTLWSRN